MKAIAYLRVSTTHQAESGLGIEAQRAACEKWAVDNGAELADVFTDEGISGAADVDKRPALLLALDALEAGAVLLVAKRDRLSRKKTTMGLIEYMVDKAGAELVSAAGEGTNTDDPMSALIQTTIYDLLAQMERVQASMRTKAALAAKRARGEKTGGAVPYGKTVDAAGKLHDGDDAGIGARIVDLRDNEGLSYREIARRLEDYGFEPKGKQFYANTIRRIYQREQSA